MTHVHDHVMLLPDCGIYLVLSPVGYEKVSSHTTSNYRQPLGAKRNPSQHENKTLRPPHLQGNEFHQQPERAQ